MPTQYDEAATLPTLESGLTLLESDERLTGALQSLVLDHVLTTNGDVLWIDSKGHGVTTTLADLAPSMRTLESIHIARAFTAYQHVTLVDNLEEVMSADVSLVVCPSFEWLYRSDDVRRGEAEKLLESILESLEAVRRKWDIPVLLSRSAADGLSQPIAEIATDSLQCTLTKYGPRFEGETFETLVYPVDGGFQTTLTYWHHILAHRHAAYATPTAGQEVTALGAH